MTIVIHANKFDSAIVEVVSETEKALQVKNTYCGRSAWIPKSGLKPYKKGVPSYENEYTVADWFWNKMDVRAQRVLNIAE